MGVDIPKSLMLLPASGTYSSLREPTDPRSNMATQPLFKDKRLEDISDKDKAMSEDHNVVKYRCFTTSVSTRSSEVIAVDGLYYNKQLNPVLAIFMGFASQLVGYGFGNFLREFLVFPAVTWWPNIVTTANVRDWMRLCTMTELWQVNGLEYSGWSSGEHKHKDKHEGILLTNRAALLLAGKFSLRWCGSLNSPQDPTQLHWRLIFTYMFMIVFYYVTLVKYDEVGPAYFSASNVGHPGVLGEIALNLEFSTGPVLPSV
ncbi:hypothetical protein BU17DRAFT_67315 [Hysterangium stoloniferum]|nr:hypothetical protein BU17DRAFT_67315 [Hysterangium stoloniferum]